MDSTSLERPISTSSFTSGDELKCPVKYGTGKYAKTELVPQPSHSPDDPLNWPIWKKDLNLCGILYSVAISGVLKTFLVTVNSTIAMNMGVKYMTISALTAVPLIISAFTGVLSLGLSQSIGKRPVYLGSALFMFIGSMWNMHVSSSYSQFMGARVFQGIGMGAFDTVVLASIQDMYFEHERGARTTFYNTVMLGATWGAPILGGYTAQSAGGILNSFMIISVFQGIGILFLILCSKETSFFRSTTGSFPSTSDISNILPSSTKKSKFSTYIRSLHPVPYYDTPSISVLIQPLRYLVAPTTLLLFLMSSLLPATTLAIANSLPLLYSTLPLLLFSPSIGYLFSLPLILLLLTLFLQSFFTSPNSNPSYILPTRIISPTTNTLIYAPPSKTDPKKYLWFTIPALLIGVSGLIAFGFYNSSHMSRIMLISTTTLETSMKMVTGDRDISLQVISLLLGLAVVGATMLQFSASTYLISSNKATEKGAVNSEMGLAFWRNVLGGVLVVALPGWVQGSRGLVVTFLGVGVVQVGLVGIAVGGLGWGEGWVGLGDKRVLGLEEGMDDDDDDGKSLERWRSGMSFMEV